MADVSLERFERIPLTEKLNEREVKSLQPRVREFTLSRDKVLFHQGDPVTFVYYVERGRVLETEADNDREAVLRRAGPGDYLGRYALVTGRPARVTATAEEETTLLAIPLRDLQPILFSYDDWRGWFYRTDVARRLRAVPLFREFGNWDIYFLADQVEIEDYQPGEAIFAAGAPSDGLYVIDRGQVVETRPATARPSDEWPKYFGPGNFFGRRAALRDEPRQATATARRETRVFRIPERSLEELLQTRSGDLPKELARVDVVKHLKPIPLFASLSEENRRLLAGFVNLVYYRAGETVSRQGEPATSLMILADGEAIVRRQVGEGQPRPVGYLKAHPGKRKPSLQARLLESQHFGDHALLHEELRGATVEVTEASIWIVLHQDDFRHFLADAGLTPDDLEEATQPEGADVEPSAQDGRLTLPFETRRHKIVLVTQVLPLAVIVVGLLVLVVAETVLPDIPSETRGLLIGIGLGALVLLIPWTIWRYVNWVNDTLTVTNQVVVHTEKTPYPFPKEERNEAPLEQIQNVNTRIGILGRIFGFGTLSVDTAAAKGRVVFTLTPEAKIVQQLIQDAAAQARGGREVQLRESIRHRLEDQLFPDRLKPDVPESTLLPPEPSEPEGVAPPPPSRGRRFLRFEIWEEDRVIWRKHWLNLVQRVGLPIVAFSVASYLILVYVVAFLTGLGGGEPIQLPPASLVAFRPWLFLPLLVLWGASALWVKYQYEEWGNDVYIVTKSEAIDVERELAIFPFWFIYTENRRQAPLSQVQNVNLDMPNLLAFLFNFGDVIVQTAGAEGTLDFEFVSNPRHVQAEVLRRLSAHQEREQQREFDRRWSDMPQWFREYRKLVNEEDEQQAARSRPGGMP